MKNYLDLMKDEINFFKKKEMLWTKWPDYVGDFANHCFISDVMDGVYLAICKYFQNMENRKVLVIRIDHNYCMGCGEKYSLGVTDLNRLIPKNIWVERIYFENNDLYLDQTISEDDTTFRYRIINNETEKEFLEYIQGKDTLEEAIIRKYTKPIEKFVVIDNIKSLKDNAKKTTPTFYCVLKKTSKR